MKMQKFKSSKVQAFKVLGLLIFSVVELLNPLNVERAFAQANFYQGKTITIIVGTKAGDVYDLYPRLLAEFMPKYIPGNPNFIIQNVPGAASLIAANQVYNIAKPDGLTSPRFIPLSISINSSKSPRPSSTGANSAGSAVRSAPIT